MEKGKALILQREEDVADKIYSDDKEDKGWLALAEGSLKDVWNNKKDDKIWRKYLDD